MLLEFDSQKLVPGYLIHWGVDPFSYLSRTAVQHHQFKVPGHDHLIIPIPVNIIDLEWKIGCDILVLLQAGGLAHLPEDLPCIHIHRSQAADIGIAILMDTFLVLGHNKVPVISPHQVSETYLPCCPIILQVDHLMKLWLRISAPLFCHPQFFFPFFLKKGFVGFLTCPDQDIGELGRHIAGNRNLSIGVV